MTAVKTQLPSGWSQSLETRGETRALSCEKPNHTLKVTDEALAKGRVRVTVAESVPTADATLSVTRVGTGPAFELSSFQHAKGPADPNRSVVLDPQKKMTLFRGPEVYNVISAGGGKIEGARPSENAAGALLEAPVGSGQYHLLSAEPLGLILDAVAGQLQPGLPDCDAAEKALEGANAALNPKAE